MLCHLNWRKFIFVFNHYEINPSLSIRKVIPFSHKIVLYSYQLSHPYKSLLTNENEARILKYIGTDTSNSEYTSKLMKSYC
jgi:hypothetical protein